MSIDSFSHKRLENEFATISAMITMYCKAHHGTGAQLCESCALLLAYSRKRLLHCPFQEDKPTCGNCQVHCYKPEMKKQIKEVMRYAGPRMTFHHPLMALKHLIDNRRPTKSLPKMKKK